MINKNGAYKFVKIIYVVQQDFIVSDKEMMD